jgi:DNA-binding HxlR family transcriptional regulator
MTGKRSYDDGCATAHALELFGERWALLVIRELMLGPKRFTDLRASLPGISPNVLTQRLEELEGNSIVVRRKLPPPASVWVYDLTDWGRELEPAFQVIGRWAARSPNMRQGLPMSVNSLVLSLRTMFSAQAARDIKCRIQLNLDGHLFRVVIAGGRMDIDPGSLMDADATIQSDPNVLAGVIYDGRKLSQAAASGDLTVKGDKNAVKRFINLFPLPEKAPAAAPMKAREG